MTVRLPRSVHEQLRRLAFETPAEARESMNDIAIDGITAEIQRRLTASTEIPLRRRPPAEVRERLHSSGLPEDFVNEITRVTS